MFLHFINRADIGVVQGRGSARLTLKALQGSRIARQVLGQEFQGDAAPQADILCFVHDSHAAATDPREDPIVREGLARQCCRRANLDSPGSSRLLTASAAAANSMAGASRKPSASVL